MKRTLLAVAALVVVGLASGRIEAQDGWSTLNTSGGQNWHSGGTSGYSTPNVFGG
jgi:hypothetical protein